MIGNIMTVGWKKLWFNHNLAKVGFFVCQFTKDHADGETPHFVIEPQGEKFILAFSQYTHRTKFNKKETYVLIGDSFSNGLDAIRIAEILYNLTKSVYNKPLTNAGIKEMADELRIGFSHDR